MDLQTKKDILFVAATVIFTYFLVVEREKLILWLPTMLMILVSMQKVKGMLGT